MRSLFLHHWKKNYALCSNYLVPPKSNVFSSSKTQDIIATLLSTWFVEDFWPIWRYSRYSRKYLTARNEDTNDHSPFYFHSELTGVYSLRIRDLNVFNFCWATPIRLSYGSNLEHIFKNLIVEIQNLTTLRGK